MKDMFHERTSMFLTPLNSSSFGNIGTNNNQVKMFQRIQDAIHKRKLPCFVEHIRAHSNLPGPLAEGNAMAEH